MVAQALIALHNGVQQKLRRIQDLKRRILFLEDENPTALIEPDIEEFITSGRLVNAIARNTLDEENPDDVFQEQGDLQFSFDVEIFEKRVVLLFERSIQNLGGIFLNIGEILSDYPLPSVTRSVTSQLIAINIEQIPSFDPTTITWNNQNEPFDPGGTGIDTLANYTWGRGQTSAGFTATEVPATVRWTAEINGALPIFPGSDWKGTIALLISISHSINFKQPITTGSVIISPEQDITGATGGQSGSTGEEINVNSSFLVDVAFGSQVKCTDVPATG